MIIIICTTLVSGVSRKGSMACPPILFNPITLSFTTTFCLCSYLLIVHLFWTCKHPLLFFIILWAYNSYPNSYSCRFPTLFSSIIIWTDSLPHPQAYAVFMSVHNLHHLGIRNGMFVFEISWGPLVIIMEIKQVSAKKLLYWRDALLQFPNFWLPQ